MKSLFTDYRILWDKRRKSPKRDKSAIRADLESMTETIDEAMIFTKNKVLKENRETEVRLWLNTDTPDSYILEIHYDPGYEAWYISLSYDGESVGEIISDKWRSMRILPDENVETENVDR